MIDKLSNRLQTVNPMLDQELEEQAALYASGALTATEREQFELVLEFHDELRTLVRGLEEVAAAVTLSTVTARRPAADLKARLMQRVEGLPQAQRHGFVMTTADGLVQYVNPEFTEMCGYSMEELRGRKLGPLLQGKLTDPGVAGEMRAAVHERRRCEAELINYHKNGDPYWVRIEITPIFAEDGNPRWLVAREEELRDRELPTAA